MTCAAGLLYVALPVAPLTAQAVIWAFLVVGTLAVFGVGRRLLDADAGLLAAFLFATAPFVVFMLLNFQLDLPLAAMVALALYTLVRTEDLALRRWSLGLGLVLGLGMLTKPPFAAYSRARFSGWPGGGSGRRSAGPACCTCSPRWGWRRRSRCRGTGRAWSGCRPRSSTARSSRRPNRGTRRR